MNELAHAKTDIAIQGRIAALSYGMQLMRTQFFGTGLGNFTNMFLRYGPLEKVRVIRIIPAHDLLGSGGTIHHVDAKRLVTFKFRHFNKATHGAYNQNGAKLGYVGLFLFVGILYCCIRTLLLVKSKDDDEERIRRALFAMVVAYAISCWMVDFCYRPTFFLFVAAISAFHRHLLRKQAKAQEPVVEAPRIPDHPWLRPLRPINLPDLPAPMPAGALACLPTELSQTALTSTVLDSLPSFVPVGGGSSRVLAWHKPKTALEDALRKRFIWTRLGFLDLVITLALTYAAIRYWQHLIVKM
jgi:hypothetical protein